MKKIFFLIVLFCCATTFGKNFEERKDFKKFFSGHKVKGSFLLYDLKRDKWISYNSARTKKRFIPASTYKIPNSLIGLETGVIPDENFVIAWDSVQRPIQSWNRNHSLASAFEFSVVPYYQELARRVGEEQMQFWINRIDYGNKNISGGIDKFWLSGGLRVSQAEQIYFLRRLYENKLPISQRSIDIVKKIMLREETPEYKVRAKTGWTDSEKNNIGWYVGWVEKGNDVYFFATNIEAKKPDKNFAAARIEITKKILRELKILPELQ